MLLFFSTHLLRLEMLGCQPGGPFGPLDGGQLEPLRLLDKGQKGFLGLGVRARIPTEPLQCKTKAQQHLHIPLGFVIKVLDWVLPNG